jgi:hypothetical protein
MRARTALRNVHRKGFLRAAAAKLPAMQRERSRYLTIFLLAAASAAIVWFVFHSVYENLSESERVVGYVDSLTQMGIDLGYVAMVGGTLILAAIAAWGLFGYVRCLLRER